MFNRFRTGSCFLWIMLFFLIMPGMPANASDLHNLAGQPHDASASVISEADQLRDLSKHNHDRSSRKPPSLSQLLKKYPDTFRSSGPRIKQVALTFDDVPDPRFTGKVLDILKQHQVKATFFAVGERAKKHPDLMKRIHKEGHAIGNHSYNHAQLNKLSFEKFKGQIERTDTILKSLTGVNPRLIRPPYGDINEEQLQWARKNGYKVVNWNVDSLDWKGLKKEEVKHNILSAAGPGSIVLQHAGGGVGSDLTGTIEALPDIISELQRKGFSLVTLPDMLGVSESR
ncbi:polysaccharide deacetylase family protein [Paenibacillus solani]|uniref:Chitooligosaccharide deacetylase n=1 Tax=Paenibacillus solani TaxID=1705565 RepID=A0A0M1P3B8_9BACL|nr:polysaccharide deacetylase family protein [Paenibacillus solani]KOR88976.1 chitooligosaccharide deacetylase [Paenibacillus solani]